MKCPRCGRRFPANWYSPSPGGFSSPGVFFVFNVGCLFGMGWAMGSGGWPWLIPLALALLIGLGGNLTSWGDADCHMKPDGTAGEGVKCPDCRQVMRVMPWSF